MNKFQVGTILKSYHTLDGQMHSIGKAARPFFRYGHICLVIHVQLCHFLYRKEQQSVSECHIQDQHEPFEGDATKRLQPCHLECA